MFMFINVVQSVMLSCMVVLYRPLVSGTSMEILLDPGEVQHWVIFQSWPYRGLVWSFSSSSASVTCHQATCLLRNKAFSWDSEFSIVAFFCPIHFGFHERAGGLCFQVTPDIVSIFNFRQDCLIAPPFGGGNNIFPDRHW